MNSGDPKDIIINPITIFIFDGENRVALNPKADLCSLNPVKLLYSTGGIEFF